MQYLLRATFLPLPPCRVVGIGSNCGAARPGRRQPAVPREHAEMAPNGLAQGRIGGTDATARGLKAVEKRIPRYAAGQAGRGPIELGDSPVRPLRPIAARGLGEGRKSDPGAPGLAITRPISAGEARSSWCPPRCRSRRGQMSRFQTENVARTRCPIGASRGAGGWRHVP